MIRLVIMEHHLHETEPQPTFGALTAAFLPLRVFENFKSTPNPCHNGLQQLRCLKILVSGLHAKLELVRPHAHFMHVSNDFRKGFLHEPDAFPPTTSSRDDTCAPIYNAYDSSTQLDNIDPGDAAR